MKSPGRWIRASGVPVRPDQVRTQSLHRQRCAPARVEPHEIRVSPPQFGQGRCLPALPISTIGLHRRAIGLSGDGDARLRAVARAASALAIWAGGSSAMDLIRASSERGVVAGIGLLQ